MPSIADTAGLVTDPMLTKSRPRVRRTDSGTRVHPRRAILSRGREGLTR
jgi:hypothetical protein